MDNPYQHEHSQFRLLLAMTTAAIVFATAYLVAWNGYRNFNYGYRPDVKTLQMLTRLRGEIERHKTATGKLPTTLAELKVVKEQDVWVDKEGRPMDYWGHPLLYRVEGDNYLLMSFGRDGEPGGRGIDADLDSATEEMPSKLSVWDFTEAPDSTGMKLCCLLAGLFAFPICYFQFGSRSTTALSKVLAMHAVTAVFAFLAAVLMSVLHLPTGH